MKEVKSYNKGALNPTSNLINSLHSFDLDPVDPLPAIKKWVGETFNGANWDNNQVPQNKYCTHAPIIIINHSNTSWSRITSIFQVGLIILLENYSKFHQKIKKIRTRFVQRGYWFYKERDN